LIANARSLLLICRAAQYIQVHFIESKNKNPELQQYTDNSKSGP
jgi:hypothetical protein